MTKHAIVIAFGLTLSASCLPQQSGWKAEPHDSLLVAPDAKDVDYKSYMSGDSDGGSEEQAELIYSVQEPYPASKFLDHLRKDLQAKGWEPISTTGDWGCGSYEGFECGRQPSWRNSKNENVTYELRYKSAQDPTLRTLWVDAHFSEPHVTPPPSPSESAESDRLLRRKRLNALGFLAVYLVILAGIIRLLTLPKVKAALFFAGEGSKLTTANLVLIAPSFLVLLSLGAMLLVAALSSDGNFARDGVLGIAVLGWVFLAFCAVVAVVASPIVIILTVGILYSDTFPRNVKIGHAVLGLLSLSFWVVCIACFSGPLMHW